MRQDKRQPVCVCVCSLKCILILIVLYKYIYELHILRQLHTVQACK